MASQMLKRMTQLEDRVHSKGAMSQNTTVTVPRLYSFNGGPSKMLEESSSAELAVLTTAYDLPGYLEITLSDDGSTEYVRYTEAARRAAETIMSRITQSELQQIVRGEFDLARRLRQIVSDFGESSLSAL